MVLAWIFQSYLPNLDEELKGRICRIYDNAFESELKWTLRALMLCRDADFFHADIDFNMDLAI